MKSELSKTPNVPIFLKDCVQTAFIYDRFAVHAEPTSPLYHDLQSVAELAFDACIGMLEHWEWLVRKTKSNAPNPIAEQEVTMDFTLLQAVTNTLECVSSCRANTSPQIHLNHNLGV